VRGREEERVDGAVLATKPVCLERLWKKREGRVFEKRKGWEAKTMAINKNHFFHVRGREFQRNRGNHSTRKGPGTKFSKNRRVGSKF